MWFFLHTEHCDLIRLRDKPGAEATAIAFSCDGCHLAWGDATGTLHLISAPKP
ncbi:MAG: hypothetical protein WCF84_27420 [Anaerolineae bacterium]